MQVGTAIGGHQTLRILIKNNTATRGVDVLNNQWRFARILNLIQDIELFALSDWEVMPDRILNIHRGVGNLSATPCCSHHHCDDGQYK
jgi:hypothetical protein